MVKTKVDSVDAKIGERLKSRRGILGITQQDLASLLQISFQQVQKYEKGVNRLGPKRLLEICQALNVPVSYFFQDIDGYQNFEEKRNDYYGLAEETVKINPSIQQEEIDKLVSHYMMISSVEVRQHILNLVITLSEIPEKTNGGKYSLAPFATYKKKPS